MNELVNQYRPAGSTASNPASSVRDLIREGSYAPGDRLPPERELTDRLGLTRSALRRGLEELERGGEIWRHVGKGTFVASSSTEARAPALSDLSRSVSPLQMMRARLSIEPALAREAAINAGSDAAERIRAIHERAKAADSWDAYEAEDDHLHRAIAEATGNALLLALFDQLNQVRRAVAWDTVTRASDRPPADHKSFAQHEDIVRAIEARKPADANAAMREHLGSVSARLFGDQ